MSHGRLLIHQRRSDRPKMGHVCVASHSTSDSETGSPLECTSLALWISYLRIKCDSQQPWMLLYSPINYAISMHKTWRSHASVGMMAHEEPRTDLDSHEAVCLQARSVRPLSITHDAVIHGAMSDATLSARRAGRSPMASPACARVRSASNSIKSGLGMGHSGGRATPQARAGCGGSICAAVEAADCGSARSQQRLYTVRGISPGR